MSRFTILFVLGLVCLCAMPLAAQDAVLGQMYGSGVHAYFNEDYVKTHQCLTTAIDGKTQDPRAYYFRGLALLKLGRPQEAETDFKSGAKLESAVDPSRVYNVARALERIQGNDRATLEKYRLEARMAALQRAEDAHRRRYQETMKEQRDFLQQQSISGAAKPVETPVDVPKAPDAAPAANTPPAEPFSPGEPGKVTEPNKADAGGAKMPEAVTPPSTLETPAEKPTPKAPETPKPAAGSEDPFGADATKPAPPAVPNTPPAKKPDAKAADAADDPFGAEAAKSAAPAAPATPPVKKPDAAKPAPAAGGEDPFGAEAPAAGTPAKAAPAIPPAKKSDAKPAAGEDPFGAEAPATAPPADKAAPPAKKSAPAKAPSDDPFGG
jgi:hypothetical protein